MREPHCSFRPVSDGIHALASSFHCRNLPSFPVVDCNIQHSLYINDTSNAVIKSFMKRLYACAQTTLKCQKSSDTNIEQ